MQTVHCSVPTGTANGINVLSLAGAGYAVVSGPAALFTAALPGCAVLAEESNKRNTKRINVIKSAHLGFAVGSRNVPALSFCF